MQEQAAQEQAESSAIQRRVQGILSAFRADKVTLENARQQLGSLKQDAEGQRDSTKQKFGQAKSDSASDHTAFQPKTGDSVLLLTMKGAKAMVICLPRHSKAALVRN